MFDRIAAAACIAICAVADAWGWWWENGSEKKADKKGDDQADRKR